MMRRDHGNGQFTAKKGQAFSLCQPPPHSPPPTAAEGATKKSADMETPFSHTSTFPSPGGFSRKKNFAASQLRITRNKLSCFLLLSPTKNTIRFRANDRKRFTRISFVKVWGFSKPRIEMSQSRVQNAKTRFCPTKRGEQRSRPRD